MHTCTIHDVICDARGRTATRLPPPASRSPLALAARGAAAAAGLRPPTADADRHTAIADRGARRGDRGAQSAVAAEAAAAVAGVVALAARRVRPVVCGLCGPWSVVLVGCFAYY
jgi:hypothetical protein